MDVCRAVLIRVPVEVPSVSSWQRQSGGACQLSRGGWRERARWLRVRLHGEAAETFSWVWSLPFRLNAFYIFNWAEKLYLLLSHRRDGEFSLRPVKSDTHPSALCVTSKYLDGLSRWKISLLVTYWPCVALKIVSQLIFLAQFSVFHVFFF